MLQVNYNRLKTHNPFSEPDLNLQDPLMGDAPAAPMPVGILSRVNVGGYVVGTESAVTIEVPVEAERSPALTLVGVVHL